MICALCKTNEANKKNTHYLTDGIIRSCLNQDGIGEREKGFYFDLSNKSAFIEFNFQRETSIEKLTESLGRNPTDEEIERAKNVPFSVDFVFCNHCEDIFSEIESFFIDKLLPKFRNTNLDNIKQIEILERKEVRLFFYIQIWRSHICENTTKLSKETAESLRKIILNNKATELTSLNHLPLSITYLQTSGDLKEYTTNFVGFTNDQNPNLIFLNDFVIQFYESKNDIRFFDFHGLNSEDSYTDFINQKEEAFIINVFEDSERKKFLNAIINAEKVKQTLDFYRESFNRLWFFTFGGYPPVQITQEYINEIVKDDFEALKYSRDRIVELTKGFMLRKLK